MVTTCQKNLRRTVHETTEHDRVPPPVRMRWLLAALQAVPLLGVSQDRGAFLRETSDNATAEMLAWLPTPEAFASPHCKALASPPNVSEPMACLRLTTPNIKVKQCLDFPQMRRALVIVPFPACCFDGSCATPTTPKLTSSPLSEHLLVGSRSQEITSNIAHASLLAPHPDSAHGACSFAQAAPGRRLQRAVDREPLDLPRRAAALPRGRGWRAPLPSPSVW